MNVDCLKEVSQFLNPEMRPDVKISLLEHIITMTRNVEGIEPLLSLPDILERLIFLMQDRSADVSELAALPLINITAEETGINAFLIISETSKSVERQKYSHNLVEVCIRFIMNTDSILADSCCMILSNMTRPLHLVDRIIALIEKCGYTWGDILQQFIKKEKNTLGPKLHYLGSVFNNLSRSSYIRRYLVLSQLELLLPGAMNAEDIVRRRGIVGILKNCCFDVEGHEWILDPMSDILATLLFPLAGPEKFDDEDYKKLPDFLQNNLSETKKREPDTNIRIMLLEALLQLCATKKGRETLRDVNVYVILRELHKWEKDKNALLACENVVDILIRTEEEIGTDNVKDVEVPVEYKDKFHQMDKDFIDNN